MKNNIKAIQVIAAAAGTLLVATPVFAITVGMGAGANVSASTSAGNVTISAAMQTRINTAKDRADQEITRRASSLTDLDAKVQASAKLTADEKNSLHSSIQQQISTMNDLKAKIDADTDITTLKADIKSITDAYRIYMLIIPQGRITVASDKLRTTAEVESTFATKLSARIDTDAAAGKDVTAEKTALADMQAKLSDATAQIDAAVALVANLTPDNGDKTKQAANTQALKDAHTKIKAAVQDEVTARADAHTIVKGLTGNASADATASSTTH